MVAKLFGLPGGPFLVGLVGVVLVAAGGYAVVHGVRRDFLRDLALPPRFRTLVTVLGTVGWTALGVAGGAAGGLLIAAAVQFDPRLPSASTPGSGHWPISRSDRSCCSCWPPGWRSSPSSACSTRGTARREVVRGVVPGRVTARRLVDLLGEYRSRPRGRARRGRPRRCRAGSTVPGPLVVAGPDDLPDAPDPEPGSLALEAATGVGSLPGTDVGEAAATVVGELPLLLPHLPELPARGVGADMIGRTAALLVDLAVEVVPTAGGSRPGLAATTGVRWTCCASTSTPSTPPAPVRGPTG